MPGVRQKQVLSKLLSALTQTQFTAVVMMPYITVADYVPEPVEVYESLPEPWRSDALELLRNRNEDFDAMSKAKLATFE